MKRILRIILLLAALSAISGCANKFKKVKITSVDVESVTPTGLKSFKALVSIGIDNPAPSFNIMNLKADLRRDTVAMMHLYGENLAVEGKCEKVYRLPVTAQIDSAVSLLKMAYLVRSFNPAEYVVDISARAVVGGIGKNLVYKDIPLSSLMDQARQ